MSKEKVLKRILVIGGAGFIGSNLCEKLAEVESNEVFCLDNYSSGSVYNHKDGVSYIQGHSRDISEIIKFSPELIYHLGEYSRVENSLKNFPIVQSSNIHGTLEVIKFASKSGSKLVYAGSSTKFAQSATDIQKTPYSWTKEYNTELIKHYANWYGLRYAITYFYNTYGSGECYEGEYATLIGIFKKKYASRSPLPVVLPGTQRRNFTHVDDIVTGLLLVGKYGEGDLYGIGHHEDYSVLEVANMFSSNIEYLPERFGNRESSELFTDKIIELGWTPKISLKQHVLEFKKIYNHTSCKS